MTPSPAELLDRERAVREIDALIAEAHAREEPAIIRIAGAPGIGKSRLLRHLVECRSERGLRAAYAAASASEAVHPGALVRRLPGIAADIPERQIVTALAAVLSDADLVCIDDFQWTDELSSRLLRRVVREAAPRAVVVLADRREEAPDAPRHRSVYLRPLRRAAALRLVRLVHPTASDDVAEEIVDVAHGIPFVVELLSRAAAHANGNTANDVEPSLEAAIALRLRRCDPLGRDVLRHAAIAYAPTVNLLARAIGAPTATISRELAACQDLVESNGDSITFRHALIADVIVRSIDDPSVYHRDILRAYDLDDDRVGWLAAALRAALGCMETTVSSQLAVRLARRLAAGGALETAAAHAKLACDLAPRPTPAEYLTEYAGIVQSQAKDHEAASFLRTHLGAAIDRGDIGTAADLIGTFAASALALERPDEVAAYAGRIRAASPLDAAAIARVDSARYNVAAFGGEHETLMSIDAQTARWPDHRPLAFAAALAGDTARSRSALQYYRAGLAPRHARVTGNDRALEAAIGLFATGAGALRSWDDDTADPYDVRGGFPTNAALRIVRCTAIGHWREADDVLAAMDFEDDVDEPFPVLDARLMYQAIARKTLIAPRRTERAVRLLIAQGRKRHAIAAAAWLWIITIRSREPVPADIRQFVASELQTVPMPYLFGGIPLAVAWLAPLLDGEQCLLAVRSWAPFESAWHRAHRMLALGIIRRDHTELRAARDAFDALDAPVFAAIAGLLLPIPRAADVALSAELGLVDEADAVARGELSPRERDIAELAATGLKNRDIAARLHISERTVEVHLTSVLRKLRVRSRAGIASRLLRVGRVD